MQIFGTVAKVRNGQDVVRLRVDDADPSHLHLTENDGDTAKRLKESVFVLTTHNGFVALAKRGIKVGQPLEFGFRQLALGNVLYRGDGKIHRPARCSNTFDINGGIHHRAVFADKALVHAVAFGFSLQDTFVLGKVFFQIVWMGQFGPIFFSQFFAGITENEA